MRLAMLYALLNESTVIRKADLQAGLALWHYAEQSARHIFGQALGDPVADEILRALRAALPGGLSQTDIRNVFHRNKHAQSISTALHLLLDYGMVRSKRDTNTGGAPKTIWFACA
jgi:hypothetical protein